MSVTADVWAEEQDYHRQRHQLHARLSHGAGVLTGLGVVASDPPDSAVYILPGIAMDGDGQIIVLSKPRAYNIGTTQGYLYLLLTGGQSAPRGDSDQPEGLRYVHDEFGIQATPILPSTPYVELARIDRRGRDSVIANAEDVEHPAQNQIDLRFRTEVGAAPAKVARIAVSYLGDGPTPAHAHGMDYVVRLLRRDGTCRAWVDDDVPLGSDLDGYTLVYLVGQAAFQMQREEMNAIYAYVQDGGTIFYEGCRKGTSGGDSPADASFADLLGSFGLQLEAFPLADHDLLSEPYLFTAPPDGFETGGSPEMQIGGGIITSKGDYGCLWQGERRSGPAARHEIRTALEWGCNLVAWALSRSAARP